MEFIKARLQGLAEAGEGGSRFVAMDGGGVKAESGGGAATLPVEGDGEGGGGNGRFVTVPIPLQNAAISKWHAAVLQVAHLGKVPSEVIGGQFALWPEADDEDEEEQGEGREANGEERERRGAPPEDEGEQESYQGDEFGDEADRGAGEV